MAKYPGSFIINEVGTRKELAGIYGVSERTIYRWLNRAAKESGLSPHPKKAAPTPAELAAFKGTRAQLAANYGVSPRTAYRWLAKARAQQDTSLPGGSGLSRSVRSKYPGVEILNVSGSNKQLADLYDVSPRTVSRWKRKAKIESGQLLPDLRKTGQWKLKRKGGYSRYEYIGDEAAFEQMTEEAYQPENVIEPPEEYIEPVFEEPIEAPEEPEDLFEVEEIPDVLLHYDFDATTLDTLQFIADFIVENEKINNDSLFAQLSDDEKLIYLTQYIEWQWENNPRQFSQSPESLEVAIHAGVHRMDIWGNEFETWLNDFYESSKYQI